MQRRTFLIRAATFAAAALPLGVLQACSGASSPAGGGTPAAQGAPGGGGAPKSFKYGDLKSLGDVGIYVAAEEGYFAEQGLQVEITSFDSAANMVAPLGAGQLDAAGGAISAGLFNAMARNIPMKIVADKGHSEPTPPGFPVSIYLARKPLVDGGQVKSAADLKGRKFGWVARGISTELDLAAFLKSGGLGVGDVDLTQMGFPDMVSAMANGAIDACAPPEPFATNMVGQGTASILGYDYQVNPRNQVAVILYGAEFAKSDLAPRFMVAYLRAVRMYNDAFVKKDPTARQKVVAAAVKYSTVKDPALYDKMQLQGLYPNGDLNVDSIKDQQEYFLSTGTQQERVALDSFIDTHFAQDAVTQLGPYS
jgi:NitT/TauT family transport system substrate-binding protein